MIGARRGLAAGVLAAGLVLSACGGASQWPQGSVPAAEPSTTSGAPAVTAEADSSPAAATGSPDAGTPGGTGAAAARCRLDDLRASVGPTVDAGPQNRTPIVWTNTSGHACTMTGFGGVDLEGPDSAPYGPVYSLRRQEVPASAVRLAPGGAAHTTIIWIRQDGWTPRTIRTIPPDETRSVTLPWPGGGVPRQDGATHPGTYLAPIRPGTSG